MGAPQAQRVDARLEQARAAMAAEDWEMVMTRLPAEAETIRRFHVTAILP
jgi:cytochrome c-type biogenesis protein CcmH/NrfG